MLLLAFPGQKVSTCVTLLRFCQDEFFPILKGFFCFYLTFEETYGEGFIMTFGGTSLAYLVLPYKTTKVSTMLEGRKKQHTSSCR
jgi:ABC-type phosphate transport system permease subunit